MLCRLKEVETISCNYPMTKRKRVKLPLFIINVIRPLFSCNAIFFPK